MFVATFLLLFVALFVLLLLFHSLVEAQYLHTQVCSYCSWATEGGGGGGGVGKGEGCYMYIYICIHLSIHLIYIYIYMECCYVHICIHVLFNCNQQIQKVLSKCKDTFIDFSHLTPHDCCILTK